MNPALLVIDLQQFFFKRAIFSTPAGEKSLTKLVYNTNELIDFFFTRELPIVHIRTVHKEDGSTRDLWMKRNNRRSLVEKTEDARELTSVHRYRSDIEVIKTRGNSFLRTTLEETLRQRGVDTLFVTGYSTNRCVGITAAEAFERDFNVVLAGDAILGADPDRAERMLSFLRDEFEIMPVTNAEIIRRILLDIKLTAELGG